MPAPDEQHVYVCDLGADQIHVLAVGERANNATLKQSIKVPDGSGPRHLVFFEEMAYVVMELSLEVQAYSWDGSLLFPQGDPVQVKPPNKRTETLAEIAVTPDGRFVYVSCRGDPEQDVLAVLPRTTPWGMPSFYPCGGRVPRHFSMSPDASWIVVANQGSETLSLLARDPNSGAVDLISSHAVGPINYAGF